jgi:hypothetical protein
MAEVEIFAGICGFTTHAATTMAGKKCHLEITSDCPSIQNLAKEIKWVDPYQEISFRWGKPDILTKSELLCPHAACPVPSGLIKAVEVAAQLALPADVRITIKK